MTIPARIFMAISMTFAIAVIIGRLTGIIPAPAQADPGPDCPTIHMTVTAPDGATYCLDPS